MIYKVTNENHSMSDAARQFGQSLAPAKHLEGQEALRFARWFGDERKATDLRPADLEAYVETIGANSPNASVRADALKGFLAYCHKQKILPERMVSHVRVRRSSVRRGASQIEAAQQLQLTAEGCEGG